MRIDLPDVNVLVALHLPDHVHHEPASAWFNATNAFATTPITEVGLVRLLLNPKIAQQAISSSDAMAALVALRGHPRAKFVADRSSLADVADRIDVVGLVGHQQVTDFHLLNLARSLPGRLVTFDRKLAGCLAPADSELLHALA